VYVVCFVWHFMTTSPPSTHHSGIVPTVLKCQTKNTTYTVGTIPEWCVLGGEVVIKCQTKHTTYTRFLAVIIFLCLLLFSFKYFYLVIMLPV
jgi:hypothetical protein